MNKRNLIIAAGGILICVGIYFILTYERLTPEQQILLAMEDARKAFELGRRGQYMKIIASDYEDNFGMTKPAIDDLARQAGFPPRNNRLTIENPQVVLVSDTVANVVATVTLTQLSNDGQEIGKATAIVTMVFKNGKDGWQISFADGYMGLTRAYGEDFL